MSPVQFLIYFSSLIVILIHKVASTSLDSNLYDISHSSCGLQLIPFLSQPVLNIIWKSSMIIIGHASGEKSILSWKIPCIQFCLVTTLFITCWIYCQYTYAKVYTFLCLLCCLLLICTLKRTLKIKKNKSTRRNQSADFWHFLSILHLFTFYYLL